MRPRCRLCAHRMNEDGNAKLTSRRPIFIEIELAEILSLDIGGDDAPDRATFLDRTLQLPRCGCSTRQGSGSEPGEARGMLRAPSAEGLVHQAMPSRAFLA